jgi:predicted nuclease of predicted toxin-antitoxin system
MPERGLSVLLDQNIPREVVAWLRKKRSAWTVTHTASLGMEGSDDAEIFRWAQAHKHLVITYDEDFADARFFPLGSHHGIVRLRVWPTTVEETISALNRLLEQVPTRELPGSLIIIDEGKIRLRRLPKTKP